VVYPVEILEMYECDILQAMSPSVPVVDNKVAFLAERLKTS
jgi:hypothetical protein